MLLLKVAFSHECSVRKSFHDTFHWLSCAHVHRYGPGGSQRVIA